MMTKKVLGPGAKPWRNDESVVLSTIREDPADQNQIQSQDELTNANSS